MNKLLFRIALVAMLLCRGSMMAQTSGTRGTDFWVGYMSNNDYSFGNQTLSLFATCSRPCTATITNPNTGWTTTLSVTPTGNNQVYIPLSEAYNYNNTSGSVLSKGIHVTSTDTIWLFAITEGSVNLDIANILPTEMLGSQYWIQTFPSDRYPTEFLVVAAEDNVTVDIFPDNLTSNGWYGTTYTVTLPTAGKSIQIQSVANGDLTNSRITARNGKKIAVFNGDACVYIPSYSACPSCDHAVEQAVPVEQWGNHFVARGSARQNNKYDRVRITALEGGCQISKNGLYMTTIGAGQSYLYEMSSNTEVDYFVTSKPAVVYEYFPSMNNSVYKGDPSMTTLPPLEQGVTDARFLSPSFTSNNLTEHSVIIVTPTSNVNNITFDNSNIGSEFSEVGSNSGYSYVYKTVEPGNHHIHSSESTFVAYSFGFGNRVSYGYGVGFSSQKLRQPNILVNDLLNPSQIDVCQGDSVQFTAIPAQTTLHRVDWVNQEINTSYHTNPVTIQFPDTGTYHICAFVSYSLPQTTNYVYDTICTTVHVIAPDLPINTWDTICANSLPYIINGQIVTGDSTFVTVHTEGVCHLVDTVHLTVIDTIADFFDTSVCQSALPVVWHDYTIHGDSTVTVTETSSLSCDSIITYRFHVISNDTVCFDTTVCQSTLPFLWHGNTFTGDSVLKDISKSSLGCDSITFFRAHVVTSDTIFSDTSICTSRLPFYWYDTSLSEEGVYYYLVPIVEECDSVFQLTLSLRNCDCDEPEAIWAPNIFTPVREKNKEFKVLTFGVLEAKIVIFDRRGDYVTELDALTQSWDGTKQGRPCKQGAYVYKIYYYTKCAPNEQHTKIGTVILIR